MRSKEELLQLVNEEKTEFTKEEAEFLGAFEETGISLEDVENDQGEDDESETKL